jgi:hypothetical protein
MIALKTYSELEAGKKFEEADICCHDKIPIEGKVL